MKKIILFHGFNGKPLGSKYEQLHNAFHSEQVQIINPALDYSHSSSVLRTLEDISNSLNDDDNIAVVGTSFGGLMTLKLLSLLDEKNALERLSIQFHIINPSLQPYMTIPLRETSYDAADLRRLEIPSVDQLISRNKSLITFYISTNDELLDHTTLKHILSVLDILPILSEKGHRWEQINEVIDNLKINFG